MEFIFQLGMILLAAPLCGRLATALATRCAITRRFATAWVAGVASALFLQWFLLRGSDPLSRFNQLGSWFLLLETLLLFGVPTAAANLAALFFAHVGPFHDDLRILRYLSALGFLLAAVPTALIHVHIMECIYGVDGMGPPLPSW